MQTFNGLYAITPDTDDSERLIEQVGAVLDGGARILQFDHTVEGPPTPHANFIFDKKGWASETIGDFVSFAEMVRRMDALQPRHALLKFVVEGAE